MSTAKLNGIGAAIDRALAACPAEDVLIVLTGHFVGLTAELVRRSGGDPDLQIKIDGGKLRDLTIHPVKAVLQ